MTERDVTVIIPTRNRATLLATTLATVRGQLGVEPEVVIVDDGSAPDQAAAIEAMRDERTTVLRNVPSRGVAAARNQGLKAASTRWVAFLDDDDLWTPSKLAGQLAAARDTGAIWVYSGAVKFEVGPILWQLMPPPMPEDVKRRLAEGCIIPAGASNVLAERQATLDVGGFDESLQHMADWDLWLRLLSSGVPAVAPAIAVAYRLHPRAMSLNPEGMLRELGILDKRWRGLRAGRELKTGPTHLWVAMSYLRAGDRSRAALHYLQAVPTRPKLGLRGLLRTLHPATPTPAHVPEGRNPPRSKFKRIQNVVVPAEMEALLNRHAAVRLERP